MVLIISKEKFKCTQLSESTLNQDDRLRAVVAVTLGNILQFAYFCS